MLRELVGQCWRSEYGSEEMRAAVVAIKVMGLTCKAYYQVGLPKQLELTKLIRMREAEAVEEEDRYYSRLWYCTKKSEKYIPLAYRNNN